MRPQRSFQLYSIILLCLSTFVAAYPWPKWLPELDAVIVRRQDSSSTASHSDSASATATTAPKASATESATSTNSDSESSASATDTNSGSKTTSAGKTSTTKSGTKATTSGHKNLNGTYTTSYDPTNPAGGISMLIPAATTTTYFKIGDYVTFAWNYTSLLATPTAVNVMATCTANSVLYPIAMNQTVGNSTGAVTWDTGAYQATAVGNPLLTQTYTLIIYDAASSISATSQPGYLAVYNSYSFGMYSPQPYTPLSDWTCATCSGALSEMERRALGLMFGMTVVTVMSFTWFVSGLGVIW